MSLVELTDGRGGVEGVLGEPNHTTARKPGPLYTIQFFLVGSKEFCTVLLRKQFKKAIRLRKYLLMVSAVIDCKVLPLAAILFYSIINICISKTLYVGGLLAGLVC